VKKNFWLLWPRFAGAAAICLLLGLGVWMLIPGNEPDQPVWLAQAPLPPKAPASTDLAVAPQLSTPAATPAPASEFALRLGSELKLPAPSSSTGDTLAEQETASAARRQFGGALALDRLAANESLGLGVGGGESAPASRARVPAEELDRLSEASVTNGLAQSNRLLADASSAASANTSVFYETRSEQPAPAEPAASPGTSGEAGLTKPAGQVALGSAVAPRGAPADNSLGRGFVNKTVNEEALSNVQQFTRSVKTDNAKTKGLPARTAQTPVLAAFAVEQAGKELRIIDNDGSVYSGNLEMTPVAAQDSSVAPSAGAPAKTDEGTVSRYGVAPLKRERAAAPVALETAADIPSQLLSFRVAGTNRTLNQNVVFIGNFAQPVPPSAGYELTNAAQAQWHLNKDKAANSLPQALSSRILGKAVLDDGKEIEIEALPNKQ
ncbi:MAG TPA: hypothetical protein VN673_00710, partial [Clostridia bacterium]|nr:hypothetical protein [Clostridia bacterium]